MGRDTGVVKDQSQGVKMIVSSMYTVHCTLQSPIIIIFSFCTFVHKIFCAIIRLQKIPLSL